MRSHKKNFRTSTQRSHQNINPFIPFSIERHQSAQLVDRFGSHHNSRFHRQLLRAPYQEHKRSYQPKQINVYTNYGRQQQSLGNTNQSLNIRNSQSNYYGQKQVQKFEYNYNNYNNGHSQQNFRQDFDNLMLNFIGKIVQKEQMQKSNINQYSDSYIDWESREDQYFYSNKRKQKNRISKYYNKHLYKIEYDEAKQAQKSKKQYIKRPIYTIKYCIQLIDAQTISCIDTKYGSYCGGTINPNMAKTLQIICKQLSNNFGNQYQYIVTSVIINNVKKQLHLDMSCVVQYKLFDEPLQYEYERIDRQNKIIYGLRVWTDQVQLSWHKPVPYSNNNMKSNSNISNLKSAVQIDGYTVKLQQWAQNSVTITFRKMTLSQYKSQCFEQFIHLYNPQLLQHEKCTICYDEPLNIGIICL